MSKWEINNKLHLVWIIHLTFRCISLLHLHIDSVNPLRFIIVDLHNHHDRFIFNFIFNRFIFNRNKTKESFSIGFYLCSNEQQVKGWVLVVHISKQHNLLETLKWIFECFSHFVCKQSMIKLLACSIGLVISCWGDKCATRWCAYLSIGYEFLSANWAHRPKHWKAFHSSI